MSLRVIDTDHVSLALRGHPLVLDRLSHKSGQAHIAIITVQEVFNGWVSELNQPNTARESLIYHYHHLFNTMELLRKLPILEFDAIAFDQYEKLLLQNPNLRKKRLQKDMRIAAIALANDAIVVTRNRRDFEQVPSLKIEDWTL